MPAAPTRSVTIQQPRPRCHPNPAGWFDGHHAGIWCPTKPDAYLPNLQSPNDLSGDVNHDDAMIDAI
ncbi:uncharacterized protein MYCFIDRAFT_182657 [Pseudocercospora fijiensis CIRAD86]|uniref:Uncharacterized protein n=1 Tax=Pseudocercospora fijiensis (strain CIRAD86) TaxID=383855 RepID=M3B0C6_PSEFD|nr:uncharacterized protein MYCFIDRAFT_182657 [Pseudocercospora fijiensis CIRAD86]EME82868.1 hypothetical protein MYCFIDRAFT_182657 [Pseudocercospora fijiensis CIRAD86]